MTGSQLRKERSRRGVYAKAVAHALGVTKQQISALERQRVVSDAVAARYIYAVDMAAAAHA